METADDALLARFGAYAGFFASAVEHGHESAEALRAVARDHAAGVPESECLERAAHLLAPGTAVRLEGLAGRQELNFCLGSVVGAPRGPNGDRWPVRVRRADGALDGVLVRPCNLRHALQLVMLPADVLSQCLLSGLDGVALARLEATCTRMRALLGGAQCWRAGFRAAFGPHAPLEDGSSRESVRRAYRASANWATGCVGHDSYQNHVTPEAAARWRSEGPEGGEEYADGLWMASPVIAASSSVMLMGCDESERDCQPGSPVTIVRELSSFEQVGDAYSHLQPVCMHKLSMCGERVYAYSLEDSTVVRLRSLPSGKGEARSGAGEVEIDTRTPPAEGEPAYGARVSPCCSAVTCLAGAPGKLLLGTQWGLALVFGLGSTDRAFGPEDALEVPTPRLLAQLQPLSPGRASRPTMVSLCLAPHVGGEDEFGVVGSSEDGLLRVWAIGGRGGGICGGRVALLAHIDLNPRLRLVRSADGSPCEALDGIEEAIELSEPSFIDYYGRDNFCDGGVVATSADYLVIGLDTHVCYVYRWADPAVGRPAEEDAEAEAISGRSSRCLELAHVLLEPVRLHTSGTTDAMYLYDSTSTPYIVIARNSFLATVSRIGAAVCVWDLRPGALLYRLEHALSRQVSGINAHDEMPEGCHPTGLAIGRGGTQLMLAVSGGTLFVWDFSAGCLPPPGAAPPFSHHTETGLTRRPETISYARKAVRRPRSQHTWGEPRTGSRAGRVPRTIEAGTLGDPLPAPSC